MTMAEIGEGKLRRAAGSRLGRPPAHDDTLVPGSVAEQAQREFIELGLSTYEARVLIALLQAGSATAPQLCRLASVPRTNTYQILESLVAKRVAERIPGDGPAVWATPGQEEVLTRLEGGLEAALEERLRQHRARTERLRELLADVVPDNPAVTLPFVHLLRGTPQVKRTYEQVLAEVTHDLVMFTRPPYSWIPGNPNQAIFDMLARGVHARVLYQAAEWEAAEEGFRAEIQAYHEAGVEGRLVDHLPIKLVVVDDRRVFASMPGQGDDPYPTTLLVEHDGYAEVLSAAFEQYWATSRPLTHVEVGPPAAGSA